MLAGIIKFTATNAQKIYEFKRRLYIYELKLARK